METKMTILMFGARRCGKSSTLASMIDSVKNLGNENISVEFSETTKGLLKQKIDNMNDIFSPKRNRNHGWIDDMGSNSNDYLEYNMDIRIAKQLTVHVSVIDLPGEEATDYNKNREMINAISLADVVLVAVDSPHIVEPTDSLFDFNFSQNITKLFKDFTTQSSSLENKLLIFVPTKCEKYMYNSSTDPEAVVTTTIINIDGEYIEKIFKIDDVCTAIKLRYDEVIYQWQKQKRGNVMIVPVLTLGGLVFDHFSKIEAKRQIKDELGNDTYIVEEKEIAHYEYVKGKNAGRHPKYCEQPFIYAIEHLIQRLPWKKESENQSPISKFALNVVKAANEILNG